MRNQQLSCAYRRLLLCFVLQSIFQLRDYNGFGSVRLPLDFSLFAPLRDDFNNHQETR